MYFKCPPTELQFLQPLKLLIDINVSTLQKFAVIFYIDYMAVHVTFSFLMHHATKKKKNNFSTKLYRIELYRKDLSKAAKIEK